MDIRRRPVLLLDLDGTLIDSAPGIVATARHTLEALGKPAATEADLRRMIGPPLDQGFARLLGGKDELAAATKIYRARYAETGILDASAFPGVLEALSARAAEGTRLFVCTSKNRTFAESLVERLGFAPLMSGIYGREPDGRFEDKAVLMAHLLATEELDRAEVCMVGDREHDVIAAKRNGLPSIGVLWGYGDRAELEAAGADLIIGRPAELLA